ncbi:uncharacterized protein LOC113301591 [Papaver somniferum]|uniref:uncharacterized protein LOC113301591 n=1 Tax=Papaver somniferum TaxID=3469 RepID=UPI000E704502|nr:uncharacterized protein LOC113301591 [Papaver somniferum]
MKGGRSHRLASTEPPDDWVNGSWTVDCSCGVTFDDGEEMVNCDECGVWVHTRCSQYVKGETSFSCDKCKKKKSRNDNNEETEVAQLLVELTSKTMRMDNLRRSTPSAPPRPRPAYRLWTEIPVEDRAHVQGVPGGDSSLFQELSSVFNSELWKCSGYVPKKFNFQYREFPCWDDEKEEGLIDARIEEETDNIADRGANVLCSLWKDKPTEMEASFGGLVEEADCKEKIGQKEKYSENHVKIGQKEKFSENHVKKDKTHLAHAVHPSKQKEFVRSKERSGKKKARSAEKEADRKKRAFTPPVDARKVVCHDDGGSKVGAIEFQHRKKKVRMEVKSTEPNGGCPDAANSYEMMKHQSASKVHNSEHLFEEASRSHVSVEVVEKSKKVNSRSPTRTGDSPKIAAVSAFLTESNTVGGSLANIEHVNMVVHSSNHVKDENHELKDLSGSSFSVKEDQKVKSPVRDLQNDVTAMQDNNKVQVLSDVGVSRSPVQRDTKLEKKTDVDLHNGDIRLLSSSLTDEKLEPAKLLEKLGASISPSLDEKCQNGNREMKAVDHCRKSETVEITVLTSRERSLHGEKSESSAIPPSAKEASLESKPETKNVEEPSVYDGLNTDPRVKVDQQKAVSAVGKSSTSPTIVFSRSSFSASSKTHETKGSLSSPRSINSSKQVKTNVEIKKDHPANDVLRKGGRHDAERKTANDLPKVYSSSGSKASQISKTTHVPSSKRVSHSKEQVPVPSSKTSTTHNVAVPSSSFESASSLHTQNTSHVQNKGTPFGSSLKGDRLSQSSCQPSQKLNHSPAMHPPAPVNSSPALSDEELALLLHQELNSSPRVPRVPRVRHGGTLPQLGSPTAASMLVKRTSSTGTKDQLLFSRRKREDASRDSSRKPNDRADETKKEKLPSCLDQRRQDPQSTANGSTKVEACNGSSHVISAKKNALPPLSSNTAIGGPSSSSEVNDHKPSSVRSSSRDMSDDEIGAVMGPTPRTLPGLLDEIMSKGKRMSYEELCNAVLPHWHKLRKHNGERYAYTSHSQAVLDCLRNRNEWAQLVDRGPKTSASRKRRKLDSESLSVVEGVEDDFDKSNLKEVEVKYVESQREDYPKGKRMARKRRRLALQGRGIMDIRKKQKADAAMDGEDLNLSSQSSEGTESMFSEEESQGTKTGTTEALTSEDETGSML